ncbi:MAG: hypothetical protein KAT05_02980 [Spirochaetes bacterium]|nr:hypothetical protein [Spirochaetota bacterium]
MITVNTVLSEISDLSLDEKELVEDVLHKRIVEEKREKIYKKYLKSKKEYKENKLKFSNNIDELKEIMDS